MSPTKRHVQYTEPTSALLLTSTAGKHTNADAAQPTIKHADTSLPPSLQNKRRPKRHTSRELSLSRRLFQRELGIDVTRPDTLFAREKFSGFRLQNELDVHQGMAGGDDGKGLLLMRTRMKIVDIVSTSDLIFALSENGVCAVFNGDLGKRICFMNVTEDEFIRSLFLNKLNHALITVSVFQKDDEISGLHCRSTPLSHIRKGYLRSGKSILETERLRWPYSVLIDDFNGKIFTLFPEDEKYLVWDLRTYRKLYTIPSEGIEEINFSPGLALLILARHETYVPIRILNVETGDLLKHINHMIHREREIDFIGHFNDKLFVNQESENMEIVDIFTGHTVKFPCNNVLHPHVFTFLCESESFLTSQRCEVNLWNFSGEHLTTFEDHTVFQYDLSPSTIHITKQRDFIVSYCKQESSCGPGSINISCIDTGKVLSRITSGPHQNEQHLNALNGVTSLYYNEERNEIYSGTHDGRLHVWSN